MKKIFSIAVVAALSTGCASVSMESIEQSNRLKQFDPPPEGKAGLYIYRDSVLGSALKKDVWVDDECIGETSPHMFFYHVVEGDKEHKLSTESEFSPNDLLITTKSGENYFFEQYIKMGMFVGGANIEQVTEEKGKAAISNLGLAKQGSCSK